MVPMAVAPLSKSNRSSNGSIFLQLKVLGFEDANGNAIEATLVTPEPRTLGIVGVVLLLGVCERRHYGLLSRRDVNHRRF